MKLRPVTAAILLLLSGLSLAAHADDTRRPYIVQLADKPLSSYTCLLYTSPSPRDRQKSRMPSSA